MKAKQIAITTARKSKPVPSHESSKKLVPTRKIDDRPAGQKMTTKTGRGNFSVNDWANNGGEKYGDR